MGIGWNSDVDVEVNVGGGIEGSSFKGGYLSQHAYLVGDIVVHDGALWYFTQDVSAENTADDPADVAGAYKISDGSGGGVADMAYRGVYHVNTEYAIGDMVDFNNSEIYLFTAAVPDTNSQADPANVTGSRRLTTPTQLPADWDASTGVQRVLNKPTIPSIGANPQGAATQNLTKLLIDAIVYGVMSPDMSNLLSTLTEAQKETIRNKLGAGIPAPNRRMLFASIDGDVLDEQSGNVDDLADGTIGFYDGNSLIQSPGASLSTMDTFYISEHAGTINTDLLQPGVSLNSVDLRPFFDDLVERGGSALFAIQLRGQTQNMVIEAGHFAKVNGGYRLTVLTTINPYNIPNTGVGSVWNLAVGVSTGILAKDIADKLGLDKIEISSTAPTLSQLSKLMVVSDTELAEATLAAINPHMRPQTTAPYRIALRTRTNLNQIDNKNSTIGIQNALSNSGIMQLKAALPDSIPLMGGGSISIGDLEANLNLHHRFELYSGSKVIKGTVTSFTKVFGEYYINLENATQVGTFDNDESVTMRLQSNLVARDEFAPVAFSGDYNELENKPSQELDDEEQGLLDVLEDSFWTDEVSGDVVTISSAATGEIEVSTNNTAVNGATDVLEVDKVDGSNVDNSTLFSSIDAGDYFRLVRGDAIIMDKIVLSRQHPSDTTRWQFFYHKDNSLIYSVGLDQYRQPPTGAGTLSFRKVVDNLVHNKTTGSAIDPASDFILYSDESETGDPDRKMTLQDAAYAADKVIIQAGSNITVTPSDTGKTITIANSQTKNPLGRKIATGTLSPNMNHSSGSATFWTINADSDFSGYTNDSGTNNSTLNIPTDMPTNLKPYMVGHVCILKNSSGTEVMRAYRPWGHFHDSVVSLPATHFMLFFLSSNINTKVYLRWYFQNDSNSVNIVSTGTDTALTNATIEIYEMVN